MCSVHFVFSRLVFGKFLTSKTKELLESFIRNFNEDQHDVTIFYWLEYHLPKRKIDLRRITPGITKDQNTSGHYTLIVQTRLTPCPPQWTHHFSHTFDHTRLFRVTCLLFKRKCKKNEHVKKNLFVRSNSIVTVNHLQNCQTHSTREFDRRTYTLTTLPFCIEVE